MRNQDMPAMPIVTPDMPVEGSGGLTKLEHFAGLATYEDIEAIIGETVEKAAEFIGIEADKYRTQEHWHIASCKARIVYAKALLEELEKEQS